MKLSDKRRQAIFAAVDDEILTLRLRLNDWAEYSSAIDAVIAQVGARAASAAIKAAEGEGKQCNARCIVLAALAAEASRIIMDGETVCFCPVGCTGTHDPACWLGMALAMCPEMPEEGND